MGEVKLIVMCGLPGSGKSTYAAKLAKEERAQIVSSDRIREQLYGDASRNDEPKKVFGRLFYKVDCALKYRHSVIIDCVNPMESDRKKYLKKYAGMYDKSVCVFVNTPIEECKRRNSKRDRVVPEMAIDKQASKLFPPTEAEGFDEIIVIT